MAKSTKKAASKTETSVRHAATERNRDNRLERHIKKYPKDMVAQAAVGNPAPVRRKPKAKGNFPEKQYFARDAAGNKETVGVGFSGYSIPERRPGQSLKAYEIEVSRKLADGRALLKETGGQFGDVTKRTEKEIKDGTRALCHALGIHFTGKAASRKGNK